MIHDDDPTLPIPVVGSVEPTSEPPAPEGDAGLSPWRRPSSGPIPVIYLVMCAVLGIGIGVSATVVLAYQSSLVPQQELDAAREQITALEDLLRTERSDGVVSTQAAEDLAAIADDIIALQQTLATVRAELEAATDRRSALQSSLAAAQAEIAELEQQLASRQLQQQVLDARAVQLGQREAEVQRREQELRDAEDEPGLEDGPGAVPGSTPPPSQGP